MKISQKDWNAYVKRLSKLNAKAASEMTQFIDRNGVENVKALIDYAYGLTTKYGEASAALSAEMYDAIAALERAILPAAEMAETATYGEVAKTIQGIMKTSVNTEQLSNAVGRMVKQAGADTTLKNAIRDNAEYAWVPVGDTCAFCIALAANGWQPMSSRALKGDHAEHIHANCDCTYAVRFTQDSGVAGYDPDEYYQEYMDADTSSFGYGSVNNDRDVTKRDYQNMSTARINGMRRAMYAKNKDMINAQKREAYALRKEAIEDGEIKT